MNEFINSLKTLFTDIIEIAPYALVSIILIILTGFIIKYMNKGIKWIMKTARIDELFREILPKGTRISITYIIILLIDVGIIALTTTLILRIFQGIAPETVSLLLLYVSRLVSIIVMLIVFTVSLDLLSRIVALERKIESLFFILLFFFGLSMIIDLTGLSESIKQVLAGGVTLGIGISLGLFVAWILFGDYLERLVKK